MMHCERSIRLRCWRSRREPDSQYGRLWNVRHSLRLEIRGLDDGPPLLDFGLLINGEGLRRLLVAWVNLLPEVGEPRAHRLVSEGRHGGAIEPGDDILWRTRWRPKGLPVGKIEPRQAGLIHRRDIRCRRHAALGRDCQSASNFDPRSASNFDPLERRVRAVALAPSELVGVAETAREIGRAHV